MLAQKLPLELMQTSWAQALNPVIACPLIQGRLIQNQVLVNGTTIVNHKLGRKLVGWIVVGINSSASIFDNQASNQTPELTLSLTSNAMATVNLWVF